ncbi:hypothetical protein THUN1379_24490 [Paludibacterium sp. THUN1379]|uniref:alpha/beta hydrolase n=1 Tax=Paludibacterium sp. THUN1379 TaxID=3112107 RepID=UPI00308C39CE|nr:hypothetical protein THUN1379_24490 [Paludibacterium sp. THUN1379]
MYSTYEREKLSFDAGIIYQWPKSIATSCIIFTHGLGGDIEGTWGSLPMMIMGSAFSRNKDILVYSYRTSVINPMSKSIQDLSDEYITFLESLATKYQSIYFVTHSLGSVLTLGALTELYSRSDTWNRKIRGHILLAPALWGSYLGWVSPSKTSRELKYKSKKLALIRQAWAEIAKGKPCKSFVLFGTEDKIIEKNISDLTSMNIASKSVAKSHISIPKSVSIDEITFRSILDCLYEISGSSPHDSRNYIKSIVAESSKDDWEYDDHLMEFVFMPDHKLRILQFDSRGEPRDFNEPWVKNFPDHKAQMINFAIYYDNQRIFDFPMICCDGFRYTLPMPKSRTDLSITIEQYRLGQIMEKSGMYNDFEQGLAIAEIHVA